MSVLLVRLDSGYWVSTLLRLFPYLRQSRRAWRILSRKDLWDRLSHSMVETHCPFWGGTSFHRWESKVVRARAASRAHSLSEIPRVHRDWQRLTSDLHRVSLIRGPAIVAATSTMWMRTIQVAKYSIAVMIFNITLWYQGQYTMRSSMKWKRGGNLLMISRVTKWFL